MNKYIKNYKKQRPLFSILEFIIKVFSKKVKIINLNEQEINQPCIFISNHSAANGPLKLKLHLPYTFSPWGINDMCQGYKVRRRYLIDTFYSKKLKYGKVKSWIIGTIFATFSHYLYKNANVIPTFENASLMQTIEKSIESIKNGNNILIFPEDSSNGYFDVLTKYYPGFVLLSKIYNKKNKKDLPVYPLYIHKKKNILIIGKPFYINKMLKDGKTKEEVADFAKNITNQMYYDYIENQNS